MVIVRCVRRGLPFAKSVYVKPQDDFIKVVKAGLPMRQIMASAEPCGTNLWYLRAVRGV